MDEYKKPKLRLKKIDTSVAKPVKGVDIESKMSMPKGLRLKKAPINLKMSDMKDKSKKEKKGKIIRRKGGLTKIPQSDRIKEEISTEQTMREVMREAMERKRLERANKERQMIKRIK